MERESVKERPYKDTKQIGRADIYHEEEEVGMGDSLGDNLMMMGSDILPEILLHDDGEREEASITEVVDFGFGDMYE